MKEIERFSGIHTSVFPFASPQNVFKCSNRLVFPPVAQNYYLVVQNGIWEHAETQTLIINLLVTCEVDRMWAEIVKASCFPYVLTVVTLEEYIGSDWQCLFH